MRWVKLKLKPSNPRHGAHHGEPPCFANSTLALVAAASLSAMALAPTAASAGGGFMGRRLASTTTTMATASASASSVAAMATAAADAIGPACVLTQFGYRYRVVNVCAW